MEERRLYTYLSIPTRALNWKEYQFDKLVGLMEA
jgi:hypothetical protein